MSAHSIRLVEQAQQQMGFGQTDQAIATLTEALGDDPNHARAHALLAVCLRDRNRLSAAALEAGAALAGAPQDPFSHYAAGVVHEARREWKIAEGHYQTAIELAPEADWTRRALGRLYLVWGRPRDAKPWLDAACEADPEDASNLATLAHWHLDTGDAVRAEAIAREALRIDPHEGEALVVLGYAVLRQGRGDEALEHAAWAVQNDPSDRTTLALLVAVKMRRNPVTGLWFRFASFVGGGSGTRMVAMLVGLYLVVRVASMALGDLGYANAAGTLNVVWLAFCVYTWFAPVLFQRALRKELEQVRLKPDY
ncbi:MAG TPA: tetratricopeptide repeat protein [Tahibacter sp.]|nr:tetratricopeptide repeat protein [Tahibacter sp.]